MFLFQVPKEFLKGPHSGSASQELVLLFIQGGLLPFWAFKCSLLIGLGGSSSSAPGAKTSISLGFIYAGGFLVGSCHGEGPDPLGTDRASSATVRPTKMPTSKKRRGAGGRGRE